MLISTQVEVVVEFGVELGNNKLNLSSANLSREVGMEIGGLEVVLE